jgi:serine/threonine-protein kinase HipA
MTMLEASDGGEGTYLEIAETIEEHSPTASKDLQELWRRIAFTRLISNTDDHLRNHGFLRTSTAGWSLSPAFDLNPNPNPQLGKAYSTVIDERQSGSEIQAAMELAEMFRLSADESRAILGQVRAATSRWREVAQSLKLNGEAIRRMAPAFEGAEARAADVAFDP